MRVIVEIGNKSNIVAVLGTPSNVVAERSLPQGGDRVEKPRGETLPTGKYKLDIYKLPKGVGSIWLAKSVKPLTS